MKEYRPMVGSVDVKGDTSRYKAILMADRIIVTHPYGSTEILLDTSSMAICVVCETNNQRGEYCDR